MSSPDSSSASPHSSSGESTARPTARQNGGSGTETQQRRFSLRHASRRKAASAAEPDELDEIKNEEDENAMDWDHDDPESLDAQEDIFYGRREIESDSSEYQPSDKSSSPEPDVQELPPQIDGSGSKSKGAAETGTHSLKRPRPRAFSDASVNTEAQPGKRTKTSVNDDYLELLNDDLDDVQRNYVPGEWHKLAASQAGMAVWTTEEKEILYESLSRLGRDDIPGITARVGSKSEVEVRHYLYLLHEEVTRRRSEWNKPLHKALLSDFPAAAEISEACCSALGELADDVVLREELEVAEEEERKWGPHWLVSGENCGKLTRAALAAARTSADGRDAPVSGLQAEMHPDALPVLDLFKVPVMLLLLERVFMNGAAEEASWMALDGQPAAHVSALHDLYGLVYSFTQRLAAAAMSMCEARLQSEFNESVERVVKTVDVRDAVARLSLKKDSKEFWKRCPRRLGLNVSRDAMPFSDMEEDKRRKLGRIAVKEEAEETSNFEGEGGLEEVDDSGGDEDAGGQADTNGIESGADDDFMTYDDVEKALMPVPVSRALSRDARAASNPPFSDYEELALSLKLEVEASSDVDDDDDGGDEMDTTRWRIKDEADEVTQYSAIGYPDTAWARTSLKKRIGAELTQEAYADAVDKHESSLEELYLWSVAGQRPPASLGLDEFDENEAPKVAGFQPGARRFPVEEAIETGHDWRDKLQYMPRWEAKAAHARYRRRKRKSAKAGAKKKRR